MDFLRKKAALIILLSTLSSGCAKFGYLYEQSLGQWDLYRKSEENSKILSGNRLNESQKSKVAKIEELKKYFYRYWEKEESKNYSKTTILDSDAVTYLVIASPHNEIKAAETCFPMMGCFPYLGFFKKQSAEKFAKQKEKEGYVTWIRPVYAYSSLGYFTDNILSSFFYYEDYDLAELIFHELFHTIFFAKNQVDFNENLATYFSQQMLEEYFKSIDQIGYYEYEIKRAQSYKAINEKIVELANELQSQYLDKKSQSHLESQKILSDFLTERFLPEVEKVCLANEMAKENCTYLNRSWNNASFAALLTYEKSARDLEKLQKSLGLDLKGYYNWIVQRYEVFQKQKKEKNFEDFLFN